MLPFREITLGDKPMVEHCGSHYNYHLCERCFVDLFVAQPLQYADLL